jgi:hypothetical protein
VAMARASVFSGQTGPCTGENLRSFSGRIRIAVVCRRLLAATLTGAPDDNSAAATGLVPGRSMRGTGHRKRSVNPRSAASISHHNRYSVPGISRTLSLDPRGYSERENF